MFRRPAVSVAVFLSIFAPADGAAANSMLCIPHAAMVKTLEESHAESRVSRGLDNSGVMVEVFAAPAGNWTIVLTQPNGMSCLMAAGKAWESLPVAAAGLQS